MQEKFYLNALKWLYQKNPRDAIVMHCRVQYDMTFKEIAGELGVSINTVRNRFLRGSRLLKRYIKKEYI